MLYHITPLSIHWIMEAALFLPWSKKSIACIPCSQHGLEVIILIIYKPLEASLPAVYLDSECRTWLFFCSGVQGTIAVRTLSLWNSLAKELCSAHSLNSCKFLLKTYFYQRAFSWFYLISTSRQLAIYFVLLCISLSPCLANGLPQVFCILKGCFSSQLLPSACAWGNVGTL